MGEKVPSPRTPLFRIGRDSGGHWVVQDDGGLCGGLFVNREEAVKFALFENGRNRASIAMIPGVFELDMSGKSRGADRAANSETHRSRLAA
jgi:hypothetical protein